MKQSILLYFIISSLILFSCRKVINGSGSVITQERPISSFTQLETAVDGSVVVVQSTEEKVSVETDDNIQQYVVVTNTDNILKVYMQSKVNLKPTRIIVTVYVKNISSLRASNNGNLETQNQLVSNEAFTLFNSSNGDLKANISAPSVGCDNAANGNTNLTVTTPSLNITNKANGNMYVSGESQNVIINNSANGDFDSKSLLTNDLDIINTANGNVSVYAKDNISIEHRGNGNLYYYGSPNVKKLVVQSNGSVENK